MDYTNPERFRDLVNKQNVYHGDPNFFGGGQVDSPVECNKLREQDGAECRLPRGHRYAHDFVLWVEPELPYLGARPIPFPGPREVPPAVAKDHGSDV